MRLNVSVEYALRAILCLAKERERTFKTSQIAQACQAPPKSLSAVLKILADKRLIHSCVGPKGGYSFLRDPNSVTLMQVVEAVGSPVFENDCLLHGTPCPQDHWCPIHEVWEKAQMVFVKVLGRYSIGHLLERIQNWEAIDHLLEDLTKELPRPKEPPYD